MICFMFGATMGILGAIATLGVGMWWFVRRGNREAAAKFLEAAAMAMKPGEEDKEEAAEDGEIKEPKRRGGG